jgi:hypothetical protein
VTFYHNSEFILVKTDPESGEQAVEILVGVRRHARESPRSLKIEPIQAAIDDAVTNTEGK